MVGVVDNAHHETNTREDYMKKSILFIFLMLTGVWCVLVPGHAGKVPGMKTTDRQTVIGEDGGKLRLDLNFGKLPLYFIENRGQVHPEAKFYVRASRYHLWLTGQGLVFDSIRTGQDENGRPERAEESSGYVRSVSRLLFLGADKNPLMVPVDRARLKVNYFIGNDPAGWHGAVPTSLAVLYKGLYRHIDLKVYGSEKQIEYDWMVKPGGNPGDIRFTYIGVKGTRLDAEGNLVVATPFGKLIHKRPTAYQVVESGRHKGGRTKEEKVEVAFIKLARDTYGFRVGSYDRNRPLIIDPVVLAYSTYLGGNVDEEGYAIAVDNSNCVYVTGFTRSTDFPLANYYQTSQGPWRDAFVTKLDTTQSGAACLLYSTYLGGESDDYGWGIAVDSNGCAYISGFTYSTDFPTLNQYQTDPGDGDGDAIVFKLDTTQNGAASLLYSTYLGGGGLECGYSIGVDNSGNVYVTGDTSSGDFPLLRQFQIDQPGRDAYLTRIDTTQSGADSLIYSTYLGGDDSEYGYGIAVDSNQNAYIVGFTYSMYFPVLHEYQTDQPIKDTFVTRIDTNLNGSASLIYSTYLGGDGSDWGYGIDVDNGGNAYVTGYTDSTDFPTLNQYQTDPGDSAYDVFVTRIDTNQSGAASLVYSTYLGGGNADIGRGIAAGGSGTAYITGSTFGADFPLVNHCQTFQGGPTDALVIKVDTTQSGASSLVYSTYLGGDNWDRGFGIAVDGSDNVYVIGWTDSTNFPTVNQYQADQPDTDAFITRLYHAVVPSVTTAPVTSIGPNSAVSGGDVTSDGGSAVITRGVCWSIFPEPTLADDYTADGSGTGSYTSLMTGLIPDTTYYVRAYAVNSVGTAYGGEEVFATTLLTTITVTSPDGGEIWEAGSQQEITWTTAGPVGSVAIQYSVNNGSSWTGIVSSTENDGSYLWTVGNTVSSRCLVRIYETDGAPLDVSDAAFTIAPSTTGIPPGERAALIALYNSSGGDNWTDNGGWKTLPLHTDGFALPGSENAWFGVTCDVANTTVEAVELSANHLVGTLAPELADLINLRELDLTFNELSGSLPPQWGNLTGLRYLWLYHNQLSGSIPLQWGSLASLEYLALDHNQLEGSLPDTLGSLSQLRYLWLHYNQLTGSIPPQWGGLANLEYLALEHNRLSGGLPPELANLTGLEILRINGNILSGSLPPGLINLGQLAETDIGHNGLYTDDPDLALFLDSRDPDWQTTQTVAPTGVSAQVVTNTSVRVSWTPILYTDDPGGYRVFYGTTPGGPYDLYDTTVDKTVATLEVGGLDPDTPYYFVVQTRTEPHAANQNTVDSDYSPEVSATTTVVYAITVTAPNGGESWEAGSLQQVTWSSEGPVGEVRLEYSLDGGLTWSVITPSTDNDGSYDWTVPDNPSDTCLVRIGSSDSDEGPSDVSDGPFSITAPPSPTITVTTPNGGESLTVLSTYHITWQSSGPIEGVTIAYSIDRGATWATIAAATENDGSYPWPVPDTPSEECVVRIGSSGSDGGPSDISDALFSIAPSATPVLRVASPNGGECLTVGSIHDIAWQSSGAVANVKIEYSADGGESWVVIDAAAENNGHYPWTAPDTPSETCLIRLADIDGDPLDVSDGAFSIVLPPSVTVISPNGGESLTVGSSFQISWTSTGSVGSLTIEYSGSSGADWTMIDPAAPNSGSYDWTVPDTLSENCLLKITANDIDTLPSDTSDGVFSIVAGFRDVK
jgi:hypothetical protein